MLWFLQKSFLFVCAKNVCNISNQFLSKIGVSYTIQSQNQNSIIWRFYKKMLFFLPQKLNVIYMYCNIRRYLYMIAPKSIFKNQQKFFMISVYMWAVRIFMSSYIMWKDIILKRVWCEIIFHVFFITERHRVICGLYSTGYAIFFRRFC